LGELRQWQNNDEEAGVFGLRNPVWWEFKVRPPQEGRDVGVEEACLGVPAERVQVPEVPVRGAAKLDLFGN